MHFLGISLRALVPHIVVVVLVVVVAAKWLSG
jgi:hypothetical protein